MLPGSPPVSATLDEAGTWTYVCKIHSHVEAGHWTGMVGTAQVSAGAGHPGSGVDFTEHRVDGARLGALREHRGRRTVRDLVHGDGGGRPHGRVPLDGQRRQRGGVKSVEFAIGAVDPDAPTVRGAADPASGSAPLLVQFSASGRDPQNRPLIYEWDFGDDHGSANATVQHTYSEARQVHGDREGHRRAGQDGHRHGRGRGRRRTATARRSSRPSPARCRGEAPLDVAFSADAIDPDGDSRGRSSTCGTSATADRTPTAGRPSSRTGPRARYMAKVTATDGDGVAATKEVDRRRSRSGGQPAAHRGRRGGAAVRHGSAAGELQLGSPATRTAISSTGSGTSATAAWPWGRPVNHTYTQPGTYTARLTVSDGGTRPRLRA